ncbi:DoxX family protein [Nocardia sp. CA2R105]|uniref:DoxX family protein n=1 Tax=Nocardia coffeae TaxID=2873381 RepID=UPI001CA7769D|nr:DoxX family protein [Nocardia coffeae]MBY8863448.1 DoxX family protein [Nocardia coffeae]
MTIAAIVISVILALLLAAAGIPKLLGVASATSTADHLQVSSALYRVIGACECAASVGLIVGSVWWSPLAAAAAVGVTVLMIGAVIAHLRVKDAAAKLAPALLALALAVAALVLAIARLS